MVFLYRRGAIFLKITDSEKLSKHDDFDHLIVMDGDGEDRPVEIEFLVNKALEDEKVSVVAKRIKRSEGPFFQTLYEIHKILTLTFTGKNIDFGNIITAMVTPFDNQKEINLQKASELAKYLIKKD